MVGCSPAFSSICNTSAKEMCVSGDLAFYVLVSDRLLKPPLENGDVEVNTSEHFFVDNAFLCAYCQCLFKGITVNGI